MIKISIKPEKKEFILPDLKVVEKRQEFYNLGRKLRNSGDLQGAIDAYTNYSLWLSDEDKHIPFDWIADIHKQLGNKLESIQNKIIYAQGCSLNLSIEVYKAIEINCKEIGEKKLELKAKELKRDAQLKLIESINRKKQI